MDSKKITLTTSLVVIAFVMYAAFLTLRPFVSVFVLAGILTIFINPFYEKLLRTTKRKKLSAMLSVIILILSVVIPLILLVSALVSQATQLVSQLITNPEFVKPLEEQVRQFTGAPENAKWVSDAQNFAVEALKPLASQAGSLLLATGGMLVYIVFTAMTLYFLLTEKESLKGWFREALPMSERHRSLFEKRTAEIINSLVKGNLTIIFLQILVGILGMTIFGVHSPVLFGTLYGVLSVIPSIGSALVWIPTAILLYIAAPTTGILFIAWCVVTNIIIDNFVSPRIIGESANMHQLLAMFAVLGGIQAFGPLGIVLGPTFIALAVIAIGLIKEFRSN